jgi:hypothetical protein
LKQANSNSSCLGSVYSQASCQTQPLEHNHLIALTIVTVIVDVFCVVVMICTWCISSTHTTGEPSISTVPASPSSHLLKTKQSTVLFSYWVPLYSFIFYTVSLPCICFMGRRKTHLWRQYF